MAEWVRSLFVLSVLPGCFQPYSGTYSDVSGPWLGQPQRVGCVDIAVSEYADDLVEGAAVRYRFGNRCDREVVFDLTQVVATGRDASGREFAMRVFDPEQQVRATTLEARASSTIVLEYQEVSEITDEVPPDTDDGEPPASPAIAMLCLDLSAVAPTAKTDRRAVSCVAPQQGRAAEGGR